MYKIAFSRYTNLINIWEMKNRMLNFLKAAKKADTISARMLKAEIERTRRSIDSARNHFEQVVDPTMIDCYIYELNAAQLRYQFLLRKFKRGCKKTALKKR